MPLARANRGSLRIAMLRRRCRAPQESADQAEAFLACGPPQCSTIFPSRMRRMAVPLISIGSPDGGTSKKAVPVCVPSTLQLETMRSPDDDKVDREGHVRERRSCLVPPLLLRAAGVAPDAVRAHPTRHVTLEVLGPEAIDRVGVTGLHRCAVLGEGPQAVRHAGPFLLVSY